MDDRAEALLDALRQPGDIGRLARAQVAYDGDAAGQGERQRLRAEVVAALGSSLRPTDRPIARWLLQQEIVAHQACGFGASESLYTLVAAVARFAQPSDALLIWRAWHATPETRAGVDVEQLGRAGLAATRAALQQVAAENGAHAEDARQAMRWLDEGAATGAFNDLPGYFLWADERFGLTTSGPT
ncbi:MAG TPA: hypothetical protein VIC27_14255 [Ktedonobacterales bacterium]|jgi:hypothetical protein